MKKPKILFWDKKGNGYNKTTGKKVNTWLNQDGYPTIKVNNKNQSVHRLIWEYFNGPIQKGLTINHKNGIKTDNRLQNLELVTIAENVKHAWKNNLITFGIGSNCNSSKLMEYQVIEIRKLYSTNNYTQMELSKKFNVDRSQISKIVLRKQWTHI